MEHIFELVSRYCFQGHTHIPGLFTVSPEFLSPSVPRSDAEVAIDLPATKAMVNVGSVGQPRDNDPRACYVVVEDDRRVRFRRIAYPFETTCRKIHGIADLDNFLGDRLGQGR
jgi:diadenosine tetraphosphatase ApaH/serine/threonine PP2A family protein phosphatase